MKTPAELTQATDAELTDELVMLIREAKAHDKWDRHFAMALGEEMAKRPGLQELMRSVKP